MDYLLFEPEDFASDESYLRYYFKLNEKDISFWEDWISNHPEKLDIIINADELISFLSFNMPEEAIQQQLNKLLVDIQTQKEKNVEQLTETNTATKKRTNSLFKTVGAVSLAIVLLVMIRVFIFEPYKNLNSTKPADVIATITSTNKTTAPTIVQLEDSSLVTLKPGSSVTYPSHFSANKREVILDGEAFFQVSKNPSKPFYVYYGSLVTHVLGTSFNVKIDKAQMKIEVAVRTGRVEVYEKANATTDKNSTPKKEKGVVLTPNQKVIYAINTKSFEATLVDKPMPLLAHRDNADTVTTLYNITAETFVFNSERLAEVIQVLEKVYGIDIEVENEHINNCHFSGDLTKMDLYEKLNIICKSLNASYKITGTSILIKGRGCN